MTDRLRVLYSFPHPLDRAGIAHTALQQIRGLAAQGLDVVLFCTSVGTADLPPSVDVHETMMLAGQRVPHRAVGVARACAYHDVRAARWLARNARHVDVVHAWPRGSLRTLRAATAHGVAALRESPNPHTASVQRESTKAVEHAGIALRRGHSHSADPQVLELEQREYDAADHILVPSQYAYDEFLAEGFPPSKLMQHRYGCDLARFPERTGERPEDRPFTAAFVGRGDPTKGLHVGLAAWRLAAIPGGRFYVAGNVDPDYRAAHRADFEAPGVQELGFVTNPAQILQEADVLVLPTWTEGSALVTLEAQASGCVPLVSRASGALGEPGRDFLQHEVGDTATLAEQMRSLSEDRARLAELSSHGTSRRAELSWDSAAALLVDLYHKALVR